VRAGFSWNIGGADEDRTHDLVIANDALSQLSYRPKRAMIATRAFSWQDAELDQSGRAAVNSARTQRLSVGD
jgi:hypothetical protein